MSRTFRSSLSPAPLTALAALALAACWSAGVRAQGAPAAWKPASAPLTTRWAAEVRPDAVRPEYPRPLAQRREWKSLNGLWEFAFDDRNEGRRAGWASGRRLPLRILVPFTYEAALSGIGKGTEVHERVWYRRAFEVPAAWRGRRIRLNFNASDWETTVWVNGRLLGSHRGGYEPFAFDVTDALKGTGPQELVVAIYDPAQPREGAYQPKGKQLGSEGIWYTRTTGIWQSVWLEPLHPAALEIAAVRTEVDPETREGRVTLEGSIDDRKPVTLELSLSREGRKVADVALSQGGSGAGSARAARSRVLLSRAIRGCDLWSPERPALYDLAIRVKQGGRVVDEIRSYCAFRDVGIARGRLTLNGKPYFYRGVLDQGYWPDGILTPPTEAAIRYDVEMTKRLGFNMARKHVKVEDPRWYYWCDRLGVAVWQDMPSSHNLASTEAKRNFRREWLGVIRATGSHPSVLHWIPFNEDWGSPGAFQDEIVLLTRRVDPTRPITDASGWTQRGLTDVIDAHDYGNDLLRQGAPDPQKPKVVGEYGGIALPVPGHTWTQGWGYQTVRDADALLRRIRFQTTQLFAAPSLSGFVYTQLTDVEQEVNGLLTYDRIPKAPPGRFAPIFAGRIPYDAAFDAQVREELTGGFVRDWLVLGPVPSGTDLRTAADSPENRAQVTRILERAYVPREGSLEPAENAAVAVGGESLRWRRVRVPGPALDLIPVLGGASNQVAYAAAVVEAPREIRDVTLLLGSDDGARVWLNGEPVWSVSRIRGVAPDQDVVRGLTLKAGRNVLLVKVAQGIGGWGVAARLQGPDGKWIPTRPGP